LQVQYQYIGIRGKRWIVGLIDIKWILQKMVEITREIILALGQKDWTLTEIPKKKSGFPPNLSKCPLDRVDFHHTARAGEKWNHRPSALCPNSLSVI